MDIALLTGIDKTVPAVEAVLHTIILYDCQHRREDHHGCHKETDQYFGCKQQELLEGHPIAARHHADEPVNEDENRLTGKEIVIHDSRRKDSKGHNALFLIIDIGINGC